VLALWRPVIEARLHEASGKRDDARIGLLQLVDQMPKPLPDAPGVWFMLNAWRLEDVFIEAVSWMVAGLPEGSPQAPSLWKRLVEHCPRHPPALLAATEGLLAAGDTEGARNGWARLRARDANFARTAAERNPALAALQTP
jgi:hypothetical protein